MRYDAVETYAFVVVNLFGVVLEVGEEAALAVFFQHLLAAYTNCKSYHYDVKNSIKYNPFGALTIQIKTIICP